MAPRGRPRTGRKPNFIVRMNPEHAAAARQVAKELEISPAYLSYMLNGKRPWQKDLYQRYMGVVNTFVNSEAESVNKDVTLQPRNHGEAGVNLLVGVG